MIETRIIGRTALFTVARPEKRNALTVEPCRQLRHAMESAATHEVRAVVVTGSGTSFCSGADLEEVYTPALHG